MILLFLLIGLALGFGIGVFLGIFPGVGPLAAIFASIILRVNRAAALIGSLLTNTWMTVTTFALASKVGSWIVGVDKDQSREAWNHLIKNFYWRKLFDHELLEIIYPLLMGFVVVSFLLGVCAYGTIYILLTFGSKINWSNGFRSTIKALERSFKLPLKYQVCNIISKIAYTYIYTCKKNQSL